MSTPALPAAFLQRPIAHRALHGQQEHCPENSRAAIRAAVEAGVGGHHEGHAAHGRRGLGGPGAFADFGRLSAEDDEVVVGPFVFLVVEAEPRRVTRVEVRRAVASADAG